MGGLLVEVQSSLASTPIGSRQCTAVIVFTDRMLSHAAASIVFLVWDFAHL